MAATVNDQPPVRIITGRGEDMDAAWAWFSAVLAPVPEDIKERALHETPALLVLMSYRNAVARAQGGPAN